MKQISARKIFSCLLVAGALDGGLVSLHIPATIAQAKDETKKVTLDEMWKDDSIADDLGAKKKPEKKESPKTVDTDTNFKLEVPDGSQSSLDNEIPAETTETAEENPNQDSDSKSEDEKTAESEPVERKIKPLCNRAAFKKSTLVKSGGWPGVGPFKESEQNTLIDEQNNKVEMTADGELIREASLTLVNQSNKLSGLLSLQMTTDFFLEALGASGNKIAAFNADLEQKQETLSSLSSEGKLTLNAGPYEVSIAKGQSEENQDNSSGLLISVKNTEMEPLPKAKTEDTEAKETKEPVETKVEANQTSTTDSTTEDLEPSTDSDPDEKNTIVSSSDTDTDNDTENSTDRDTDSTSVLDKPIVYNAGSSKTTVIASRPPEPAKKKDLLKEQFTTLISNWQSIKRRAVKNRQKENLSRILGGKALATQSQAIKFLLDKHRYYEMTPGTMEVTSYKALTPGKKYEVVAKISERRRYIDADNLRILKDQNTNYTVSYVVEQIRGQWLITDSKVVN